MIHMQTLYFAKLSGTESDIYIMGRSHHDILLMTHYGTVLAAGVTCMTLKTLMSNLLALQEKAKPASQHMFEARGPGGCLLLIEVLTDNTTRSHQDIKRLLIKNGSGL